MQQKYDTNVANPNPNPKSINTCLGPVLFVSYTACVTRGAAWYCLLAAPLTGAVPICLLPPTSNLGIGRLPVGSADKHRPNVQRADGALGRSGCPLQPQAHHGRFKGAG